MCIMSMVHDHYEPLIPPVVTWRWAPPQAMQPQIGTIGNLAPNWHVNARDPELQAQIDELRKLVAEFKEAKAAAAVLDRVMRQPDCVDPEKAKLEQRVAALEEALSRIQAAFAPPTAPPAPAGG